jgi:RNA polymerase sigma-70 factor (ECF subfamily)
MSDSAWAGGAGGDAPLDELIDHAYDDLRRLAASHLRRERQGHTLQPTALAHEAYVRLAGQQRPLGHDRAYFLSAASAVIQRILVDHARARRAAKRGGSWTRVTLSDLVDDERGVDLLALDESLVLLSRLAPRQARTVQLRFFGGLSTEEIAGVLGVSPRTVANDWRVARAWLRARLHTEPSP